MQEQGLEVILLRGEEIEPKLCRVMYDFYLTTIDRKWAMPYLSYEFFQYIFTHFRDQLVLALARKQGRWVAGTINYHKGPHLFGRYWGCRQDFRSLHFELCYYLPMAWCLENGVTRFEAGAQGPPGDPGARGPWDSGTLGPGNLGTLGPWDPGTLGPGDIGTRGLCSPYTPTR